MFTLKKRAPLIVATAIAECAQLGMVKTVGTSQNTPSAAKPRTHKPNILQIFLDDLKPTLSAFGDRTAIIPNIDRLASRSSSKPMPIRRFARPASSI